MEIPRIVCSSLVDSLYYRLLNRRVSAFKTIEIRGRSIFSSTDREKCVKIILMFSEKRKCMIHKHETRELVAIEELVMSWIEAFKSLSYFGIFLALSIEFIPAEVVLPLAGYWVSKGDMTLAGVVLAGSLGGVAGPLTLYWIGRYGGRPFLERFGKYLFIKPEALDKSDNFFKNMGLCRLQRPFLAWYQDIDFHTVRNCKNECLGVFALYIHCYASDYICICLSRCEAR